MVTLFEFLLLVLASFRLTRLIMYDKITEFIRRPFHSTIEETLSDGTKETFLQIEGKGLRRWIGELLSCYWCSGIWVAAFVYLAFLLFPHITLPFIIILAVAGTASLVEMIVEHYIN